jgi:SNF2 family DNA or RNA helicase
VRRQEVVCPAVAKGVWAREAAKWRPELKVTILSGRGSFRWPQPGEIVAVNYDILPEEAPGCPAGLVLVADEAHNLASSKAARTKRFRGMSKAVRECGGRVYVLTATPIKNRPPELWSVLSAAGIEREAFGSWPQFVHAFSGVEGRWGGYEWGSPRPEVPDLLRRVCLRRRKADVLKDMPEKTIKYATVEIDKATARTCDALVKSMVKGGDSIEIAIEKLFASGLSFEELSAARAALAKAKIPAMLELVEEYESAGEALVVFSAYRAPVDLLAGREGWATITGDTSAEDRTAIEEKFQRGELRGVACTIRAGGVAITLTRASNALFVDREWNPALNTQAEDRIYRIGQSRGVLITHLVADHVLDERISEILSIKAALVAGSVDAATVSQVAPQAVAEVDWEKIEADAALAAREAVEAAARAEAQRDERLRNRAKEEAERARGKARGLVRRAAARRLAEAEDTGEPRQAASALEHWAAAGLVQLSSDDPDRAQSCP